MAQMPKSQPWDSLIDENLKKVFEEDANADLPPQLMDLLDRLDKIHVATQEASGPDTPTDDGEVEE
ncbi:NepR family anti-sigma factor [Tritonibacter horizontis]|uniref:Anti-sigma factor NepR domain-containing protein n=1 Tax=Tritonibacter horizontis TaxID=1768241 RepID=A0A132BTE7_9RHOB|nr:NepR family anti-sigma factor [Tritonibacter horizontis]KUP91486.1 hypothetical protein TRIHO_36490 [Tritonibacter horizontis]